MFPWSALKPVNYLSAHTVISAMISNSTSATFFLLKVHLIQTSEMNGTCLSLPGMEIDICGRSVKLLTWECHFWKQEHTVVGCQPCCHRWDTTCQWNTMPAMNLGLKPPLLLRLFFTNISEAQLFYFSKDVLPSVDLAFTRTLQACCWKGSCQIEVQRIVCNIPLCGPLVLKTATLVIL